MPSLANEINDRFLIKLSGEIFAAGDQGVDAAALHMVGGELLLTRRERPRFAVVVGGTKFYRGRSTTLGAIDRMHVDHSNDRHRPAAVDPGTRVSVCSTFGVCSWVHAKQL